MKSISSCLARHPWLYIVLAFLVLITAWSTLITVAIKHSPQTIQIGK